MWWLLEEQWFYWLLVPVSTALFYGLSRAIEKWFIPAHMTHEPYQWKGWMVAYLHATIVAICTLLCIWHKPALMSDLKDETSIPARLVFSLTLGYNCHDIVDIYKQPDFTWEMMIHHITAIASIGVPALVFQQCAGLGLIVLLLEVNTSFLHLRHLLKVYGFSRISKVHRCVVWLNLGTFLVCRMGGLGYALYWLITNFSRLNVVMGTVLVIGDPIILMHCTRVLWSLVKSDILKYYGPNGAKRVMKEKQRAQSSFLLPDYKIK